MSDDILGRASIPITATLDRLAGDLDKAHAQVLGAVDKTGKDAKKSMSAKLDETGKTMSSIGGKMSLGLTAPLVAFGVGAYHASEQFNEGMANVASLIPGNTKRVAELKGGVQDLAVEVGKSTSDLSAGLYQTESAFGDTADTMKILEINAKAATAGVADTTDAINLTSAVTKGYGDTSAKAVQQASDLALMTVRLGQTTFPELASSIGSVIPFSKQLGVSQQELFASMATLTGVTGGAAEVSTQMKGALQALMAPTADASKAIKKAGYESGTALIKHRGLKGAMQVLVDASKKTNKPLQSFVSSLEGQTFALSLTGSQAKNYNEKLAAMGHAAGATDAAFKEQTEGVNKTGFAMKQAREKLEVFAEKMGDALAPAILAIVNGAEPLIGVAQRLAGWFGSLSPAAQKVVVGIVAIIAAIGPALLVFGKVLTTIAEVKKAMLVLNITMMGMAWFALAAVVLVVALLIIKHWDAIKKALVAAWHFIDNNVIHPVVHAFEWLGSRIAAISEAVWGFLKRWGPVALAVLAPFIGIPLLIWQHWSQIKEYVGRAFDAAKAVISGAVSWAWSKITSGFDRVVNYFKGFPSRLVSNLSALASILSAPFRTAFNAIASLWNNTVGTLSFHIPGWVPKIGGDGFSMPKIPTLAHGGTVSAMPGGTLALLAEAGRDERVTPLGADGLSAGERAILGAVSERPPVHVEVNYPEPEPASVAVPRVLRELAYVTGGAW